MATTELVQVQREGYICVLKLLDGVCGAREGWSGENIPVFSMNLAAHKLKSVSVSAFNLVMQIQEKGAARQSRQSTGNPTRYGPFSMNLISH